MYCSPYSRRKKASGGGQDRHLSMTCLDNDMLRRIAKAYNKYCRMEKIPVHSSGQEIWNRLKQEFYDVCRNAEWCWMKQDFIQKHPELYRLLDSYYMPEGPAYSRDWLSTIHIDQVMERYEKIHPDFKFYGPVPIDFKQLFPELYTLQIKKLLNQGVNKIGFVFNLDPGHKNGSHWVSLFIHIDKGVINFFDSYGTCPAPKEILDYIQYFINQFRKEGYQPQIGCNSNRHQYENYDCGVYCISFLLLSIQGYTLTEINQHDLSDQAMKILRSKYFRPKIT